MSLDTLDGVPIGNLASWNGVPLSNYSTINGVAVSPAVPVAPTNLVAIASTPLPLGTLVQEGNTPEQIALYLPVTGVLDPSTTAAVQYKTTASSTWLDAQPMWRIDPTLAPSGNRPPDLVDAFASVIVGLDPGENYDVRVLVDEPVSAKAAELKTLSATTRLPYPPASGTPIDVTTLGEFTTAVNNAVAGDWIRIPANTNIAMGPRFDFSNTGGTTGNPAYLTGEDRDTSILTFTDDGLRGVTNCDHWVLEDFTLQGPAVDGGVTPSSYGIDFFDGDGTPEDQTDWTIRNMIIQGFDIGIFTFNPVYGFLVYDNLISGNDDWTETNLTTNATWDDDGIRLAGIGHAVFNNDITRFGDAVSFRKNDNPVEVRSVHFYRNNIYFNCDDTIEAEYCQRNNTFYDNYTANSMVMLSYDGVYGGPYYHFRNRHINAGRTIAKCGENATGVLIYNNTYVCTNGIPANDDGIRMQYMSASGTPEKWEFRNNIMLWEGSGANADIWRFDGNLDSYTPWVCDYNGWGRNGNQIRFVGLGGASGDVATVNAAMTPLLDNGIELTSQATVLETPVVMGPDYLTPITTEYTLELSATSQSRNAGIDLPNISGGTDQGAIQYGSTLPVVGNRYGLPPVWLEGEPDLGWLTPVTNKISDVLDPLALTTNIGSTGPSSIFDAWTGFCYGRYVYAADQGGHVDYYGNEWYRFDTLADSPAWTLDRNATASEDPETGVVPFWSDGTPSSNHGYIQTITAEDRYFLVGLGGCNYAAGATSNIVWELDVPGNQYINHGSFPGLTVGGVSAACFDPIDRNILAVQGNNINPAVIVIDLDTMTISANLNSPINAGSYISAAVDPVNHRLIVVTSTADVYYMDLDNTAAGLSTIVPTGSVPGLKNAIRWSWHVDAFVAYNGTALYSLKPNAGYTSMVYSTHATTGTAPGPNSATGIYGKEGIVSIGGKSCLIVNSNYAASKDTHILPLPDGGLV